VSESLHIDRPSGTSRRIPRVLSIAGSDSGGGAGIQADLKAFAACGVHGMTAITAITAQSTVGVTAVQPVSPRLILEQVRAVAQDIGVDAVKIGMLGNVDTIQAVVRAVGELQPGTPIVLDPVMVSESGARLLEVDARDAVVELLLPRVLVVTPNLLEARVLAGSEHPEPASVATPQPPAGADPDPAAAAATGPPPAAPDPAGDDAPDPTGDDALDLARAIRALGASVVVVTGGHRQQASDVFFDGSTLVELSGARYSTGAAHGSGCTHSSVLAARLAWGDTPLQAARVAKRRAGEAVRDGLTDVGAGAGPVDILGMT
jgi:hydroxymethylpyrimidine/phosphomethylpyrimidine kinase